MTCFSIIRKVIFGQNRLLQAKISKKEIQMSQSETKKQQPGCKYKFPIPLSGIFYLTSPLVSPIPLSGTLSASSSFFSSSFSSSLGYIKQIINLKVFNKDLTGCLESEIRIKNFQDGYDRANQHLIGKVNLSVSKGISVYFHSWTESPDVLLDIRFLEL